MSVDKNIELELRSELTIDQFKNTFERLKNETKLVSQTKRLSIMFLGKVNKADFDIRLRIDNKKNAELVIKKGFFHAHNRIETSQKINKDQIVGFAKLFSFFGFNSKITERENFVFNIGQGIEIVLVKAGSIAYLEIEKMSSRKDIVKNKKRLLKILEDLKLKPIKKQAFNELCDRLSIYSDIKFNNSQKDFKKLEKILNNY